MITAFDVRQVNSNPARFDQKKADAINAEHIRRLDLGDFTARLKSYLVAQGKLTETADGETFAALAELVQTRIQVLGDAWDLISFVYVSDAEFTIDEKAASKNLGADAVAVLDATIAAIESLDSFTTAALQDALNAALVDDLGLKPRKAFGPVRVAVTGSQVSPPLFESMEILGRDKTLARLSSAREIAAK